MKAAVLAGLILAAAMIGLASPANAFPPCDQGTWYSEEADLTYTCENGQWHEGPPGYGQPPRPTLIHAR